MEDAKLLNPGPKAGHESGRSDLFLDPSLKAGA
jgi:hypothetical protein